MGEQREESLGELGPQTPPGQVNIRPLLTFTRNDLQQDIQKQKCHLWKKNQ